MTLSLGMIVEGSVAVLLAVTIGYCIILNTRLKRLHADRDVLAKMIGDLVQATVLANGAIKELKTAALEVEGSLDQRLTEAAELDAELKAQVVNGTQLIEKLARITSVARPQPVIVEAPSAPEEQSTMADSEPQSRLHAALQQLAMRPGIGGRAA
ncbi:MAG: DUF6468 domain-containing protein [Devosia sp.]